MIHGTTSGVMSAPMLVPELKMPVARARSFFGNHSATALIDAGKLPASPSPRITRESARPAAAPPSRSTCGGSIDTVGSRSHGILSANAWAIAPRLHTTTAIVNPARTPIRSMIRPESKRPIA